MKILKHFCVILTIVFTVGILLSINGQADQPARYKVSYTGFGVVKAGMTVAQASKALGTTLVREGEPVGDCYYASPKKGFKDLGFMVINRRIARVDVNTKVYETDRGARVGDTEAKIKQLYKGMVKVSPHKYVDGHYLTINVKGGKYAIIFETDGKRVTSFRAGRLPEVGYIEGCS